jgi:hypothetical protein
VLALDFIIFALVILALLTSLGLYAPGPIPAYFFSGLFSAIVIFLLFFNISPCPGPIEVLTDTYSSLFGEGEKL